jgi:hypothetical protein
MKALLEQMSMLSPWYLKIYLILAIVPLVVLLIGLVRAWNKKPVAGHVLDSLLFFGFLCFSWVILWQVIGLINAAQAVAKAGEISAELLKAGLRISFLEIVMGLVALLYSWLGWLVLRAIRKRLIRTAC